MKRCIVAILITLLSASPALAEVVLTERTEYYPVHGIGKKEIIESLEKRSPHRDGDEMFPAYTRTDIRYEYSWKRQSGRCAVVKVKVLLTLTYVYPRLAQTQTRAVRRWWDNKIRKITIHEKIHGDISKRSAYELDRKLRSMKRLDCQRAKSVLKSKAKLIVNQMKLEQKKYDRITEHGRKQHRYRGP